MKACTKCGRSDQGFYRHKGHRDGLDTFCKKCRGAANQRAYEVNRPARAAYQADYRSQHLEHIRKAKRAARIQAPEIPMWRSAKVRARKRGVPFAITPADIRAVWPSDNRCPVLGLELRIATSGFDSSSPTLDALRPELGYVPGNVNVVSFLANAIKRDVVDPAIFRKLADWVELKIR